MNIWAKLPKWYVCSDNITALSYFHTANDVVFISSICYNYYQYPFSALNVYHADRYLSDIISLRVYIAVISAFGPISKYNYDFCYAIYFSLIEYSLNNIMSSTEIDYGRKLEDIYNILIADETQSMLMLDATPIFDNLKNRKKFIIRILQWTDTLPTDETTDMILKNVRMELARLSNLIIK